MCDECRVFGDTMVYGQSIKHKKNSGCHCYLKKFLTHTAVEC